MFPVLFLGWGLGGEHRILTFPKVVLPAVVGLWAYTARRGDIEALNRPGFWLFGGYLAWLAIAGPLSGTGWTLWYLAREGLAVAFMAAVWSRPPGLATRFWLRFSVVSLLVAAWAVFLSFHDWPITSLPFRMIGTPNVAAAFLVLAGLHAVHIRRWWLVGISLVGCVALASAGAWLGFVLGLSALARGNAGRGLIVSLAYAAAVIFLALNWTALASTLHGGKEEASSKFVRESVQSRLYIARVALPEVMNEPWFGHGLGSFPQTFLKAEARAVSEADLPPWRAPANARAPLSAHNDLLRIAMEAGLPAAALWVAAVLAIAWEIRRMRLARALFLAFFVETLTDNLYTLSNVLPVLWTAVSLARASEQDAATLSSCQTRRVTDRAV